MSVLLKCDPQKMKLCANLITEYSEYLVKEFGERYIRELGITASIGDRNEFTTILSIRKLSQDDEKSDPILSIARMLAITKLFRLENLELELDPKLPRNDLTGLIVKHVLKHDSQYALTLSGLKDEEIDQICEASPQEPRGLKDEETAQICKALDPQKPRALRLASCEFSRELFLKLAQAINNSKIYSLTLRNISIKDGYKIKAALFFKLGGSKELTALASSVSALNGSNPVQFDGGTMGVLTLFHFAVKSPRVDTAKKES